MTSEAAGWDASAHAWIDTVQNDANRKFVLDEPMLAECGEVSGKMVLDVGCGEGRFCRMLADRGAIVTGIDPTQDLIEAAKGRHGNIDFRIAGGENLPFEDATFDLVVCYLVLIDIPDFRAAIAEMARVLRPGGKLVVANLQSFATTRELPWVRDANGNKVHFAVDNYNQEIGMDVAWNGISIVNFHRPLAAYLNCFIENGLVLTKFLEPVPTDEAIAQAPNLADYRRVPIMCVMTWLKLK